MSAAPSGTHSLPALAEGDAPWSRREGVQTSRVTLPGINQ